MTYTITQDNEKKHLVTTEKTISTVNNDSHQVVSNMDSIQEAYDLMYDVRLRIPIAV